MRFFEVAIKVSRGPKSKKFWLYTYWTLAYDIEGARNLAKESFLKDHYNPVIIGVDIYEYAVDTMPVYGGRVLMWNN